MRTKLVLNVGPTLHDVILGSALAAGVEPGELVSLALINLWAETMRVDPELEPGLQLARALRVRDLFRRCEQVGFLYGAWQAAKRGHPEYTIEPMTEAVFDFQDAEPDGVGVKVLRDGRLL